MPDESNKGLRRHLSVIDGGEPKKKASDSRRRHAAEAIRHAFELEAAATAFYRDCAKQTADPKLADMFDRLAHMEEGHGRRLFWKYGLKPQSLPPSEPALAGLALFRDHTLPTDGEALLELAIELERFGEAFLAEQRENFAVDSPQWKLFTELEAEEREHAEHLERELKRYRARNESP